MVIDQELEEAGWTTYAPDHEWGERGGARGLRFRASGGGRGLHSVRPEGKEVSSYGAGCWGEEA
eukprot:801954-Heterocapsa_arctica.AAC.1